jgi:hypothetical protein
MTGPGPEPAAPTTNPDASHDLLEAGAVGTLAGRGVPADRPATPVSGQMQFGCQPAAGAAEGFAAGSLYS